MGEIYQYVGDEVIISWPIQKGLRDWNCLRCFFKIENEIANRKMHYQHRYGFLPTFKAGMHAGAATVGEIGVIKKDIVYSGDVLNTTSRIQGECNRHQVSLLISSDLLAQLPLDNSYTIRPIGEISLRGKAEKMQLSSVCLN
jgi:adenylate cyclase